MKKPMTKAEARAFLRKVMGPPSRELEGQEREHMLTVLAFLDPISESNNQRTFTEVYEHAGKVYHVTNGLGEEIVEEILPENDDEES